MAETKQVIVRTPPVHAGDGNDYSSYFWLDGTGVNSHSVNGGGVAGSVVGTWDQISGNSGQARINLHQQDDGTVTFESVMYPNIFLRADGRGIHSFQPNGGGMVNCQFNAGPWEHYRLHNVEAGFVTIESAAFGNVYLRLEPGVHLVVGSIRPEAAGLQSGARLNCQWTAGPWERYQIIDV